MSLQVASSKTSTDPPPSRLSLAALMAQLQTGAGGVSAEEAKRRLGQYGPNSVRPHKHRRLVWEFLRHFLNPLVLILLTASGISALTGEVTSFLIISTIVLMSVILDFVQEHRAEQAAERLQQSVAVRSSVLRDGVAQEIPVSSIVPGDVVALCAGDLIPADARVLEARDFFVKQALLTGEPYPVEKHPGDSTGEDAGTEGATNTVFMGTSVISGSARVLVYATGEHTMLGGIAKPSAPSRPPLRSNRALMRLAC